MNIMQRYRLDWFDVICAVAVALLLVSLVLFVFKLRKTDCGKDVKCDTPASTTKIVEIETRGETHEYLLYETTYRGGLTHIPNCKYCGEKK